MLHRQPEPLELECIIDESVLHRVTGRPEVMAEQLEHLVTTATTAAVTIGVVPAASSALHCAAFGSFRLFTVPGAPDPFITCTEDLTGFNYLDRPEAIEAHAQLFTHLLAVALPPTESLDLIASLVEQYRRREA